MIRSIYTYLRAATLVLSCIYVPGCIESPQEPVAYDAFASPRGTGVIVVDGWTVTLSRADVGLGPFYFCASASGSSTLCHSALGELTAVSVVDGRSAAPTRLGQVRGYSGVIQSSSYDFGISWFESQSSATAAAVLPGGHSIHLEGAATKGAETVNFRADVDLAPQFAGQHAVATSPANARVSSRTTRLDIAFDPAAWLSDVDFAALAATRKTPGEPVVIAPGTTEHAALLLGVKVLAPLEFRWTEAQP